MQAVMLSSGECFPGVQAVHEFKSSRPSPFLQFDGKNTKGLGAVDDWPKAVTTIASDADALVCFSSHEICLSVCSAVVRAHGCPPTVTLSPAEASRRRPRPAGRLPVRAITAGAPALPAAEGVNRETAVPGLLGGASELLRSVSRRPATTSNVRGTNSPAVKLGELFTSMTTT